MNINQSCMQSDNKEYTKNTREREYKKIIYLYYSRFADSNPLLFSLIRTWQMLKNNLKEEIL